MHLPLGDLHLALGDGGSRLEVAHLAERLLQAALLRVEQRTEDQRRLGLEGIGRVHVDGRGGVEVCSGLQRFGKRFVGSCGKRSPKRPIKTCKQVLVRAWYRGKVASP